VPKSKFEDAYFAREDRFSVGIESTSGRHYVSFPVSNRLVDYEEYYVISRAQFGVFTTDHAAALDFVNQCRRHEHDDLLFVQPGRDRGTPT
jgi:hypothetical protein